MTAATTTTARTRGESLTWGARVRHERELRHWSQTYLAEQAGCSKSAVSRLENGARRVPDHVRVAIAKVFRLPPAVVFPYEDAPQQRRNVA